MEIIKGIKTTKWHDWWIVSVGLFFAYILVVLTNLPEAIFSINDVVKSGDLGGVLVGKVTTIIYLLFGFSFTSFSTFFLSLYATWKKKNLTTIMPLLVVTVFIGLVGDLFFRGASFQAFSDGILNEIAFSILTFPLFTFPQMILGVAIGFYGRWLIYDDQWLLDKERKIETVLVTFFMATTLTFLSGSFIGAPIVSDQLGGTHPYYFNRGIPLVFSGVSEAGTNTVWPAVKLSFFSRIFEDGVKYSKIINAYGVLMAFGLFFLICLPIGAVVVQKIDKPGFYRLLPIFIILMVFSIVIWQSVF
jgi:hypothetical protein